MKKLMGVIVLTALIAGCTSYKGCETIEERVIARYEQTGDQRFLDLASQYTDIANQYTASARNILQAIKSTRTTSK